jgi:hypothetical protein
MDNGSITGIVHNERHEPIGRARVQVFAAGDARNRQGQEAALPRRRANVTTSTDAEGRFEISGLPIGEYLVAAELINQRGHRYGVTFYPSTVDVNEAVAISVVGDPVSPIEIELIPVPGVRVAGSVASSSGRATDGLMVMLFQRFGSFGSESLFATMVEAHGTFEILGVSPGSYRLTVLPKTPPTGLNREFADRIIEVRDSDLNGVALVLGPGASVSGRVAMEPGASVSTSAGLRVSANIDPEGYLAADSVTALVTDDWSFEMTGLSGLYRFGVSRDKPPALKATRIRIDGAEIPAGTSVELSQGHHEAVIFVTLSEPPKPIFDGTGLSLGALIEQFRNEKVFWRQFEIAKEIIKRHDASVLSTLADWLNHEDRHIRGNVAFIFGRLGDARGLQVITDILNDRSDRPEAEGLGTGLRDRKYHVELQIREDRYYAAHLLGELDDPEAVPVLISFLKDLDTNFAVSWALGQIGDRRAVGPLLDALDDESPTIRVMAIHGLEALHAREALPRLTLLLNDNRKAEASTTSVADAAKAAIENLQ